MTDMLVKLYALPDVISLLTILNRKGLEIRRPHASEKHVLSEWVRQHFTDSSWASGCEVALENRPVSCYTLHGDKLRFLKELKAQGE